MIQLGNNRPTNTDQMVSLVRPLSRTFTTSPRLSAQPDYASFLSRSSARRKPSPIRALQPLLKIPGIISLGGGMPNPQTFPIDGISFSLKVCTCVVCVMYHSSFISSPGASTHPTYRA